MNSKRCLIIVAALLSFVGVLRANPQFDFKRDTYSFANMTVFEYQAGVPHMRHGAEAKRDRYTRRCFVMSRTAMQFKKNARFDPHAPPINDAELSARIRLVTHHATWKPALPENQRIVFPYRDLRAMSVANARLMQETIGHGWPTYWRPGNWRVLFITNRNYQQQTHVNLNAALDRDDFFVAYLTTLPRHFTINHAVLIYARQPAKSDGLDHYLVYDPNHPEGPRELTWSDQQQSFAYQKDWDFVGGNIQVFQIYGKLLQ